MLILTFKLELTFALVYFFYFHHVIWRARQCHFHAYAQNMMQKNLDGLLMPAKHGSHDQN